MARYHLNSVTRSIAAAGTSTIDFGPESITNCVENVALWLSGDAVQCSIRLNGQQVTTHNYNKSYPEKVWTEAGPLPTMITYPSVVLTNAGGASATVTVTWCALVRQDNG